jgi:hypothetical protein
MLSLTISQTSNDVMKIYDIVYDIVYDVVYDIVYDIVYDVIYDIVCDVTRLPSDSTSRLQLLYALILECAPDIVLVCRRLRQLPPMSVQIFTSNLEPVHLSLSLDKITQKYVLKPNILIIAYYHSKLWRTDSKCLADAIVCRITIRFVLFLFIDIWQYLFFFIDI